jgi:hypothetical protein
MNKCRVVLLNPDGSNDSAASPDMLDSGGGVDRGSVSGVGLGAGGVGGGVGAAGTPPHALRTVTGGGTGAGTAGSVPFVPDPNNVLWLSEMEKGFDALFAGIFPYIKDAPDAEQLQLLVSGKM